MAANISVGVGSAWKSVKGVSVGVSSAWKTVKNVWVGVGGAWKLCYELLLVSITNQSPIQANVGSPAWIGYRLNSAGTAEAPGGVTYPTETGTTPYAGEWLVNGDEANAEVRVTVNAGSLTGGDSTGAWLSLSSNRIWYLSRIAPGVASCNITVEIRNATTLDVLDSATIELEAENA